MNSFLSHKLTATFLDKLGLGVLFYDNEIWNEKSEIKIVGGQARSQREKGGCLHLKQMGKRKKLKTGKGRGMEGYCLQLCTGESNELIDCNWQEKKKPSTPKIMPAWSWGCHIHTDFPAETFFAAFNVTAKWSSGLKELFKAILFSVIVVYCINYKPCCQVDN